MIKVGGWQMFRGQIFSPRWLQPWFILPNLGRGAKKIVRWAFFPLPLAVCGTDRACKTATFQYTRNNTQ